MSARLRFREMRQDRVAMDRSPSSRSVTPDGHLRVEQSPVSKANVCPYWGHEIPSADELGLDANKVYMLYRNAASLKAAVPSLNGKPLLTVHRAQTADDHDHDVVVGAVDGAVWDGPYLKANLTFWSQDAIDAVESGRQRQLSCSYRYVPVMKSGVAPDGTPYDGIMTQIAFNHVAIVEEGRAGPDVFVGDAKPKFNLRRLKMAKDDNGSDNDARTKLLNFLASKLDGDGLLQAIRIIDGVDEDEDEDDAPIDPDTASDRRRQASDARLRHATQVEEARLRMFPNANRIRF